MDVRNVPNGPRNLCSNFTTARRKKVATMNSCIGVNVNLPRREEGREQCIYDVESPKFSRCRIFFQLLNQMLLVSVIG